MYTSLLVGCFRSVHGPGASVLNRLKINGTSIVDVRVYIRPYNRTVGRRPSDKIRVASLHDGRSFLLF